MFKITMKANGCQKAKVVREVGASWDDQVEVFYEFLGAQGYILTYSSFLSSFGDIVKERDSRYKGDK